MGTVSSAPPPMPPFSSSYSCHGSSSSSSLLSKGRKWRKLSGGSGFGKSATIGVEDRWEASKSVELLLYPPDDPTTAAALAAKLGLEIPASVSMLSNGDHQQQQQYRHSSRHHHLQQHSHHEEASSPYASSHQNGHRHSNPAHHHDHQQQHYHHQSYPSQEGGESGEGSESGRSSASFHLLNRDFSQIISTITAHDPECALHGHASSVRVPGHKPAPAPHRRSFKMKTSTFLSQDQQPSPLPPPPPHPVLLDHRPSAPSCSNQVSNHSNGQQHQHNGNSSSSSYAHTRTPSDPLPAPVYAQIKRGGSGHWRHRSSDTTATTSATTAPPPVITSPTKTTITTITSPRISPQHAHLHFHDHNGTNGSSGGCGDRINGYNSVKKPLVPTKIKTNGSIMLSKVSPHASYASISHQQQAQHRTNTLTSSSSSSSSSQHRQSGVYASLQRPRVPPPPPPPHRVHTMPLRLEEQSDRLNAQSRDSLDLDSLPSLGSDLDMDSYSHPRSSIPVPVPPPRKFYVQQKDQSSCRVRRCQALYDCEADREDELSFEEGELILVLRDRTDDEDWMEGCIESDVTRRGLFPASFVRMLSE